MEMILKCQEEIEAANAAYLEGLETLQRGGSQMEIQTKLKKVHKLGLDFFNLSERIIWLEGLHGAYPGNNVALTFRVEDSLATLDIIVRHFEMLKRYCFEAALSQFAFACMQRLSMNYQPEFAKPLEKRFEEIGLPVHGFRSSWLAF